MFYRIGSKVNQVVYTDPRLYAEYKNPSPRGSVDIVLARFFYCFNGKRIE